MGGIIENITVKVGYDIYNFNELGLEQAIAFAKMAVMTTSKDKDSAVVKLSYDSEVVQEEAEKTEEESEDE